MGLGFSQCQQLSSCYCAWNSWTAKSLVLQVADRAVLKSQSESDSVRKVFPAVPTVKDIPNVFHSGHENGIRNSHFHKGFAFSSERLSFELRHRFRREFGSQRILTRIAAMKIARNKAPRPWEPHNPYKTFLLRSLWKPSLSAISKLLPQRWCAVFLSVCFSFVGLWLPDWWPGERPVRSETDTLASFAGQDASPGPLALVMVWEHLEDRSLLKLRSFDSSCPFS